MSTQPPVLIGSAPGPEAAPPMSQSGTVLVCEVPEEPQAEPYPVGPVIIKEALEDPVPMEAFSEPPENPLKVVFLSSVQTTAQPQAQSIVDDLVRTYRSESRIYSKTTMATHRGTVIAFTMDQKRRIYYAVLDSNSQDENNFLDKDFWPDEPKLLDFPNEIEQVGFGDLGTTPMPFVKKESGFESSYPLQKDELDTFLSTTARFSAAFPFQVYSDNKFLYLFRQAVDADDDGNVFKLKSGRSTGNATLQSTSYVRDSAGQKVTVVNSTLLCDCFLLAGTSLLPVREARYRRSRSRKKPASNKDSMGASDMNGNPFYIPTKELTFISNMRNGSFDVLQLPTAIGSLKRWQIFALNRRSNLVESFNIEVGDDGFFNLGGTQLYTSPDSRYKAAILERSPGDCPFTKQPLVPIPNDIDHAESSFSPGLSGAFARAQLSSPWSTTRFTIELWCKPESSYYFRSPQEGGIFRSSSANLWDNIRIVHERSSVKVKGFNWNLEVGSAQRNWFHIAVSYDGAIMKTYLNGQETGLRNMTGSITFSEFTVGRSFYTTTNFRGEIDELRIWKECRSAEVIEEQRHFRILGLEPGLEGYYRFDEGGGSKVFDHSSKARHAVVSGTPDWVASTCPISDNGGIYKNCFTVVRPDNSTISLENMAAKLFFQQELAKLNVSTAEKPLKRQARVLLAISTTASANNRMVCLDLGVSRHGRLPRMPDSMSLPELSKPADPGNAQRVASLEEEIRNLRTEVLSKEEEYQEDIDRISYLRFWSPQEKDEIARLTKSSGVKLGELRLARSNLEAQVDLLAVESQGLNAPIRLGMKVIHSDSAGLSIHGGMLAFAECSGYPRIHVSGTGVNSVMYNDTEGKMYAAYFDTNVARTRFSLPDFPELSFVARSAGARHKSASLEITDGSSTQTCTLTFRDSDSNVTETWRELPRNSAMLADIFNGSSTRPSDLQVSVSPKRYSVEKRSSQLIAVATGISKIVSNVSATRIVGKDPGWVADAPGRTLLFAPNDATGYLELPKPKLSDADPGDKVTAEVWVRPRNGEPNIDVARIINMNNDNCSFALRLERVSNILSPKSSWKVIAEASCGAITSYINHRAVKSKEVINEDEWTHLALVYEQRYALLFQGSGDYVDCGNNEMLNIKEELTIEIFLKLDFLSQTHGILGKGNIGDGRNGSPYQVQITSRGIIQFLFQNEDGEVEIFSCSQPISVNTFYKIAISRTSVSEQRRKEGTESAEYVDEEGNKKTVTFDTVQSVEINDFYEVSFYIDGVLKGTSRCKKSHVIGNNEPLYIGKSHSAEAENFMRGKLTEVRIWNKSIKKDYIGSRELVSNDGLVCWWTMEQGPGNFIEDRRSNIKGRLRGQVGWVVSPDKSASRLQVFKNGLAMVLETVASTDTLLTSDSAKSYDKQFTLGSIFSRDHQVSENFHGMLEEVRIWKTLRSKEQLLDNMFTRLKGEKKDLVAYYTFDEYLTSSIPGQVPDRSLRANHLQVAHPFPDLDPIIPESILSTAPISNETATVRSALRDVETQFHGTCDNDSGLSACEYADLQRDLLGNLFGVLKRCYAYTKSGTLVLITGYKVGSIVTEWMGQAQFDPQVIGFVEGAPPVPSENLTAGVLENANDVGVITVNESESVSYSIGTSKEGSVDMGFMGKFSNAAGSDELLVIAPFGLGTAKQLTDINLDWNLQGNFNVNQGWTQEENQGYGVNHISSLTVATGGGFEDKETSGQLNPEVGRRTLISNMGFALVQSSTADIFALRLEHNNALVSYRMVPNRDIPPDWNILTFPINPRYTKQGTLDGKVGYDPNGNVVPDPDYGDVAKGYGEFSYYKPKEAYSLERRIRAEEQKNLAYYQDFATGFGSSMGTVGGLAAGAAASMLVPIFGPVLAGAALAGALAVVGKTIDENKLDDDTFAKRNIVNTYVWTADGGFYEESTGTSQIRNEISTGNFGFTGDISGGFSVDFEIFSFGLNFELDASLGGGMSVTKTRSKDSERNFDMEVSCSVPGDLNKYTYNEYGIPVGVYDDQGNPVVAPGKVDAYRFKTFYLDASPNNFEDLFGKVVDPIWLSNSQHANAVALRQANQAEKKPPCWRVFHRVTFISRILPEFSDTTEAPLEKAMKSANISSNWVLFQTLNPFLKDKTGDDAAFGEAARKAIREYLPELAPQTDAIIEFMRSAYNMDY